MGEEHNTEEEGMVSRQRAVIHTKICIYTLSYMNRHTIIHTVCTRAETQPHMHKTKRQLQQQCVIWPQRDPRETQRRGERERIETRTPNPSVCLFCILLHLQACMSICICVSLCTSRSWSVWPHLHHCSCVHGAFGSFGFVCDWAGQWIIQRWNPGHLSWEVAVQNTFLCSSSVCSLWSRRLRKGWILVFPYKLELCEEGSPR